MRASKKQLDEIERQKQRVSELQARARLSVRFQILKMNGLHRSHGSANLLSRSYCQRREDIMRILL